jgi:Co/Zn/Cd efflux system component
MAQCCDHLCEGELLGRRQRKTLIAVLGINAAMFLVILASAVYAHSSALLSDSLDNLGDALTYALSFYAVTRGSRTKAFVSLLKGSLILVAAIGVLVQIGYKLTHPVVPLFEVMGAASLAGLAANAVCLLLLARHRNDDINMSSVWECSRNDVAGNVAALVAAGAVWIVDSQWPDVIVGGLLALLLLRSAARVIRNSLLQRVVA